MAGPAADLLGGVATPSYYAAFISYQSASSQRAARRLHEALQALARRHRRDEEFRAFLDTSSLRAGRLNSEIESALDRSRNLVVVLNRRTRESEWVSREVRHWLARGGSRDRLFLVRADPELDLRWDPDAGDFVAPDQLPEALRRLFDVEQKWIDLQDGRFGVDTSALAGLYAALVEVSPEQLLLDEAAHQRRRRRRMSALVGVMSVLTVVALIAAVTAVRSREEAESQRTLAQQAAVSAQAEADAAESILATPSSLSTAITRAVQASRASESASVRSAMLALSGETRRLVRAFVYPGDADGQPADGVAFDHDGSRLLAWGPGAEDGTTHVHVWSVEDGTAEVSAEVPVVDVFAVERLSDSLLLGCSDSGPFLGHVRNRAEVTVELLGSGDDRTCRVWLYGGGAVVMSEGGAAGAEQRGWAVSSRGTATEVPFALDVERSPSDSLVVLAGPDGVTVVSGEDVVLVTTTPARAVTQVDDLGSAFVQLNEGWGVVGPAHEGYPWRPVAVPSGTVDVAPVLASGRITGEVVRIDDGGWVSWSGGAQRALVQNSLGSIGWGRFSTRLVALDDRSVLAVLHNTATVLWLPGSRGPVPEPEGAFSRAGRDAWGGVVVRQPLSVPAGASPTDAVLATCDGAGGTTVILASSYPDDRPVAVGNDGSVTEASGLLALTPECGILRANEAFVFEPPFGDAVELPVAPGYDDLLLSSTGNIVAFRRGLPIEVMSGAPTADLPRPWIVDSEPIDRVTTVFGQRVLLQGTVLRTSGPTGEVELRVPDTSRLVAVRPDGRGAVVESGPLVDDRRAEHVDGRDAEPLIELCGEGPVLYRPAPGWGTSVEAAEDQRPVAFGTEKLVDCLTGNAVEDDSTVLEYAMGADRGRIVARGQDGSISVTTWQRGGSSTLVTQPGPEVSQDDVLTFDRSGEAALMHRPDGHGATVFLRQSDAWTRSVTLTMQRTVAAAAFSPDASLVVLVSPAGQFEVFETRTGRPLLAERSPLTVNAEAVTAVTTVQVEDQLHVQVYVDGQPTATYAISIPVGVEVLRRLLCALYDAPRCRS